MTLLLLYIIIAKAINKKKGFMPLNFRLIVLTFDDFLVKF